jgi:DUF917 family protein
MGLTAEEAGGIQMLAASNGMTAKNVTNSIIKQTSALAKQTGNSTRQQTSSPRRS